MSRPRPLCRMLAAALLCLLPGACGVPEPQSGKVDLTGYRHLVDSPTAGPAAGSGPVAYYESTTQSDVPVMLVHGTPGSGDGWVDYVLNPPPGQTVRAIDRPGFGASGPDNAVVRLSEQADAVLAALPAGQPVILLGHSLGGPIVAWLAATHPDRVRAIILLAASMDPGLEETHPLQYVGAWSPVRSMLPRPLRNANAELMALKPELVALQALLPLIRSPVLIVHGTEDDLVPYANVAYMQQQLTGSCQVQTVTLAGANHFLPWNQAAAVRAALIQAEALRC